MNYTSIARVMLANVAPICGVLLFGWDAGTLVALYWLDNLSLAALAISRLVRMDGCGKYLAVPFFLLHFGIFTTVHGALILGLLRPDVRDVLRAAPFVAVPAIVGVVQDGFGPVRRSFEEITSEPYRRLFVVHATAMIAALLVQKVGGPLWLLLVFTALKLANDLRQAHVYESAAVGPRSSRRWTGKVQLTSACNVRITDPGAPPRAHAHGTAAARRDGPQQG